VSCALLLYQKPPFFAGIVRDPSRSIARAAPSSRNGVRTYTALQKTLAGRTRFLNPMVYLPGSHQSGKFFQCRKYGGNVAAFSFTHVGTFKAGNRTCGEQLRSLLTNGSASVGVCAPLAGCRSTERTSARSKYNRWKKKLRPAACAHGRLPVSRKRCNRGRFFGGFSAKSPVMY
jgi:hypothetical protein